MKYKIDPQIPYYPVCDGVTKDLMVKIHGLFNSFKFDEADAVVPNDLNDTSEDKEKANLRIKYWRAKAYYKMGDYKRGLEFAEKYIKELEDQEKYTALAQHF